MGSQTEVLYATAVVVVGLAMLLHWKYHKTHRKHLVGRLSQVILYPIKAGPPLHLTHAECTAYGLKYRSLVDRRFVIVGAKTYINLRRNLKLAACSLRYDEEADELVLSSPDMPDDLVIPANSPPGYQEHLRVSIPWYDNTEAVCLNYGEKYSAWLTELLGEPSILGYFHSDLEDRLINPENRISSRPCVDVILPDSKIMYQSSHPYLIGSQVSLDDLNSRLEEPVTFQQFRPNLVVETDAEIAAYDEDRWKRVIIGDTAVLYNERPCVRCPMIYVDYKNGVMKPDKEPMTTLLRYRRGEERKDKSKTVFGISSSTIHTGDIKLGDIISVTY